MLVFEKCAMHNEWKFMVWQFIWLYRLIFISTSLIFRNLKNARNNTKRLEDENRKMEERLNELKTAMSMEKEERE